MSQSDHVNKEGTIPLLTRNYHYRLNCLEVIIPSVFIEEGVSICNISYPLMFSGFVLYFRSFVSLLFLSGLGDKATLAGGSLAIAFANITGYSLFSGLTAGVESICSQAFGAKRYNYFRTTIKRGIILLVITMFPVALLWLFMKKILTMLGQDEKLASEAHTFLFYSLLDLVAQSFLHPLRVYLKTKSKTFPLFIFTLISTVLHCLVTFVFVTYFHLGIIGSALSGGVSNLSLVAFIVCYICFFEEKLSVDEDEEITEETYEDSVREWKKLLCFAILSCLTVCLEWWCYEIILLLCGLLLNPKANVASMGIIIQITSLVYIFPHTLSSGVSTRVGNELGSNQPQKARRAAIAGLGLSIVLGVMVAIFTFFFRNIWASIFTEDKEILELTDMALQIVSICEFFNNLQTTGCGILKGSARLGIGSIINGVAFYPVGILVGVVMAFWFGFGLTGLWIGMLAAQITCVVGMMVVTCMTDWELEAQRARELTAVVDGGGSSGSHNNDNEDAEAGRLIIGEE